MTSITELHVADNQAIKQGDLLFVIDPRPYKFAVQRARAELAVLDGEIEVAQRHIDGQHGAVAAAQAAVQRMEAQVKNATDSRHRREPLLPKEFVTRDKIDQVRTSKLTAEAGLDEARRWIRQRRTSAISRHFPDVPWRTSRKLRTNWNTPRTRPCARCGRPTTTPRSLWPSSMQPPRYWLPRRGVGSHLRVLPTRPGHLPGRA